MKNIQVRSKALAAEFVCDEPWAAISIGTREGWWPTLSEDKREGLLQLAFPDYSFVSENLEKAYPQLKGKLFDENFAQRILDFVDGVKDKIDTLLVHCEAGVSRSSAVAAAVSKIYLGIDPKEPYFRNPKYRPNILVYHTTIALAKKQGRIADMAEDISEPPDLDFVDEVPLEIIE
jgi:predicted protein tyrosine phosphatase